MTDYTKSTGSTGTMKITDTGTKIQFWLKAGSATFNHSLPYGYTVNGVTDNSNTFDFVSGGDWQMLKSWTVSTSQTVTFRLQDTGTSGLGGPTTLSASINRATTPDAPHIPTISAITATSFLATFLDADNDGGANVDSRQLGYGTSGSSPQHTISSDGSTTVTGLTPGTTYYVWARVHNSEGYSPWSVRRTTATLQAPSSPGIVTATDIKQTSMKVSFEDGTSGGSTIIARQIAYGTSSEVLSATVSDYWLPGPMPISSMLPGTVYYFWSRTKNSVGWSSWTGPSTAKTIGGAFVKVGADWLTAVPYVRVGGVWKIVRPSVLNVGIWTETT